MQFRVKMVTADDDSVTDIVVEGDKEEIERLSKASTPYQRDSDDGQAWQLQRSLLHLLQHQGES